MKPIQYRSKQAKLDDKEMTPNVKCLTQHKVTHWLMTLRAVTKYKGTIFFHLDCRYQDSKDPGEGNTRTEGTTQYD